MPIHALPQPLTGAELITVYQMQNGQLFPCSVSISALLALVPPQSGQAPAGWGSPSTLPTTAPTTPGIVWNNNGVVSIS